VAAVRKVREVTVVHVSDQVFLLHLGGKISIQNKVPLTTRDTLSMAYTPGVARVCEAIAEQHAKAWQLTIKGNSVAVVSDGSAVLGLGNIGPEAAMPVMEGKAMLFKEFAGIDAYPICLRTQDTEEIINAVANLSVGFGGINLEDISAPRCFEIERRLQERLDIPVFHDDQHGTAVVVAALLNAARLAKRKLPTLRVVILGAGAAGTAIAVMLQSAGVKDIVVCDRKGILNARTRSDLNEAKQRLAAATNPRSLSGGVEAALREANVLVGVSGPGLIAGKWLRRMAAKPMVFALANPVPEIMPEEAAAAKAWIVATGRSDYPNQINNVLAFPGIFRGALNVRARRVNEAMKLAAAHAIANSIAPCQLSPEYIVPSVFNRDVARSVASAVEQAAISTGVARKKPGRK